MKTISESQNEFSTQLENVLNKIKEKATSQFQHNLKNNIPKNIGGITLDNAAEQAITHGIVAGTNAWFEWEPDKTIRIAYDFLEDCNCHDQARDFAKFIPEFK